MNTLMCILNSYMSNSTSTCFGGGRRWIAIVYDHGDKVGSHEFTGKEQKARNAADEWVIENFGEDRDWVLHEINQA